MIPNFTFIIFIITETTTYCDVCSIMIAKLSVNVYCVTINNTYIESVFKIGSNIFENCIPRREVIKRNDDKVWFYSTLRREIRIRDRFRKTFLRVKSVLTESKYKQQRNTVNNLKKTGQKEILCKYK
jgi:hypothetical protein